MNDVLFFTGDYMIKTLARSIREYKKASILAPFFVAIEVVLEILIPYLMGYVIDYGVNAVKGYTWCNNLGELIPLILKGYKGIVPDGALATGNFTIVWQLSLVLLACALLSLSCGVLAGRYAAIAGSGYAGNLPRAGHAGRKAPTLGHLLASDRRGGRCCSRQPQSRSAQCAAYRKPDSAHQRQTYRPSL